MTIINITETLNTDIPKTKIIKELMDIYVPNIPEGISRRNGMIYLITGSGGSGKTNVLLGFFKSSKLYRNKYDNIFLITPESSFDSVEKHPFELHDKVYHELTVGLLESIYNQLIEIKNTQESPTYSLVIIDDYANALKDKNIVIELNKLLIKARHLQCGFIFTLQSYYFMPKISRKQITYLTMFKPKNWEEYNSISKELMGLNKEDGMKLYKYVFDEKYNHLDIDLVDNIYYKNFNRLDIKDENDNL
jgi:hypothetical protein